MHTAEQRRQMWVTLLSERSQREHLDLSRELDRVYYCRRTLLRELRMHATTLRAYADWSSGSEDDWDVQAGRLDWRQTNSARALNRLRQQS